jgi:membrane protease YdiL (CAAX protease family)
MTSALRELLRDKALVAFFALSFAFSWAYWIPVALAGGTASHFPGLLGPLLAAVVVSAVTEGRLGVRRVLAGRGTLRWLCLALVPLGVLAVMVGALRLTGEAPSWRALSDMRGLPAWPWLGVFLGVLLINGFGEEGGWRGFAWIRLRRHLSLRDAALVLTVPWALWHLPSFWIDSGLADLPPAVIPGWLVGLASGTVVLGWLYERSGSLLAVALAHTAINMASGTRGTDGLIAGVVTTAFIFTAMFLLAHDSRRPPVPVYDEGPARTRTSGSSNRRTEVHAGHRSDHSGRPRR